MDPIETTPTGVMRPVRKWTVGFLSPLVSGYYFGGLLEGVVDSAVRGHARAVAIQANDAGMEIMVEGAVPFAAHLAWERIDGFVIVQNAVSDEYIIALREAGKPVVLISREGPDLGCPTVVPDNVGGVTALVTHLIEHGHRDIVYVTGRQVGGDNAPRYAAYRETMTEHGLQPRDSMMLEAEERTSGYAAGLAIAQMADRPSAIFAATDVVSIGVLRALAESGIAVPDDIAVIGFDDIEEASLHVPTISSVAQSFNLLGSIAGDLVLAMLRGEHIAAGEHRAPTSLVPRESCGCPATHTSKAVDPTEVTEQTARGRFLAELVDIASEDGVLNPIRRGDVADLANRVVALFASVLASADSDSAAEVLTIAGITAHLVPRERSVRRATALLRQLGRELIAESGADRATAGRVDDLSHALAIALVEQQVRSRLTGSLQFQTQHQRYAISTNLLQRENRISRSLAWLSQTEVRAGTFAVWAPGNDEKRRLEIVGSYDARGLFAETGRHLDVESFPPAELFDVAGDDGNELMYLISVRFDKSDWGFLALVGPTDLRSQTSLEIFNHWAVLLTVSMDQEQAVRSLVSQREDLVSAHERERSLLEGIRVSEERYALAAEAANDGLWDWDLVANTIFYSARWKSLIGYEDDEISSSPDEWGTRMHPDDRPMMEDTLAQHLDGRVTLTKVEHRMRAADSSWRWMHTRGRSVHDAEGRTIRIVGSMTDITERKRMQDQLRRDALYDALTGLPNRTLFLERLNRALELAGRRPDYWFAVLFLDLDGFKFINDSLGHRAGDQVLRQVADRLTARMRTNDTAARFGGDEFAILLNDVRAIEDLPIIVDRILSTLTAPIVVAGQTVFVNAAVGIATSRTGYDSAEAFLSDADTAMYRAKALGGQGASVMFDESMHTGAVDRLQLETDLRQGLAMGEFELHYQPILDLDTRRTSGLEALIRWNHPVRGRVSPADFLPVAEATGLILPVSRWTVRDACRQIRAWQDECPGQPPIPVSINLSNRQFWDPDLLTYAAAALAEYDVAADAVVFEMTEGVIMHNPGAASALMGKLRAAGFKLHVDDFGTGYSSLEALHTFPIDALKIDRSFVSRMTLDTRSKELVRIMIAMGSTLGVDVIAEGIETEEEAQILLEMDCPRVQGFLFSCPLPMADVLDFIGRLPAATAV